MPWLLVIDDEGRTARLPLDGPELLAGSGDGVQLRLHHPTVSRRHARLEPAEDGVWLTDLESSNGTRVDGAPVAQRTRVTAGQAIHFGSLRCHLEAADAGDLEAALELPPPGVPAAGTVDGEPTASSTATLSIGSVRDFVTGALPELVSRMEALRRSRDAAGRGEPAAADRMKATLDLVRVAGRALFASFPCRSVEIVERPRQPSAGGGREPAVLFHAERPGEATDGDEPLVRVAAGGLETRVCFAPGFHADGVRPLVELVTRLAALDLPATGSATAGAAAAPFPTAAEPVPLPEPATVDPVVRRIYDEARRVARGEVGLLIQGESGTGKEVLAKFVHAASPRAGGELVTLNCAALPQDLLEAELFGIEKGVATGVEARPGKFEQADGGTLFLDEIGDMAAATQAKILRVLQEGEVYRLGGRAPRPARVRVIAATHRNLAAMIEAESFRLDLYHRIADCTFTLPPLRERRADLPNLALHFLARATAAQGVRARGISKAALEALLAHPWPGNVRQLEREMARSALFLEDGELLQTRHLGPDLTAHRRSPSDPADRSLRARLESFERGVILEALVRNDRNVRASAEELGVGRTTLYRRIQELGIEL